eukprot:COSAG01_NODE_16512_length_1230_cov_2.764810_3_plen_146_part_00
MKIILHIFKKKMESPICAGQIWKSDPVTPSPCHPPRKSALDWRRTFQTRAAAIEETGHSIPDAPPGPAAGLLERRARHSKPRSGQHAAGARIDTPWPPCGAGDGHHHVPGLNPVRRAAADGHLCDGRPTPTAAVFVSGATPTACP